MRRAAQSAPVGASQGLPGTAHGLFSVAALDTPDQAVAVALADDLASLTARFSGLHVLDIAKPAP